MYKISYLLSGQYMLEQRRSSIKVAKSYLDILQRSVWQLEIHRAIFVDPDCCQSNYKKKFIALIHSASHFGLDQSD